MSIVNDDGFISISSADEIGSNHDLLLEILIRLPIKSLLRFKSVSKQWQSVISDQRFARRWRPTSSSPSGLFFHWFLSVYVSLPHIDFIPLDNKINSSTTYPPNLQFFPYLYGVKFMNSANGLLCCVVCSKLKPIKVFSYHVINPSTRQFTTLPQPSLSTNLHLHGLTMAFDPAKSPHYKLVSLLSDILDCSSSSTTTHYQLEIYSSETQSWNASNETFTTPQRHPSFHRGVYWNGAILWFSSYGDSVLFQIEEERIFSNKIPELTFEEGFWYDRLFCVGESDGHLYLVVTYSPKTSVKVYEMESDFSAGWVMKYSVDLFEVGKAFPLMLESLPRSVSFQILSMVWKKDDQSNGDQGKTTPFLVMTIPEKYLIRVNLDEENSFMEMCDVDIHGEYCEREEVYHECNYRFFCADTHHYIQCLFSTDP
ncbi:F-box protein At5g07610-like [Impatiens glandulifera]|uniref:F-box protein At5g07610-like n=1 Tax=Impatiens glandulifera TaxID=253017 RepID=UPI001FB198BF|nr:F-box protein At5g07610-like [Impatiens glandulifera]